MKATPLAKRYYRTLGLSCDASDEEIREAYYRLAFTHHPDRNPGDSYAAARFKEIQVAYEWLTQRRAVPPLTTEQFPFLSRERSEVGLVWHGLTALAGVAALAVTLTMLLRAAPRMGAAVKTESPRPEQLPDLRHFATKLHQPVKIPHEEFTTARSSLTAKRLPINGSLQQSAVGRPELLSESSVKSLLESVVGSSPESFAAALDAACKEFFSSERLTEIWQTSPSWQVTTKHELPVEPMSITWTVFDSSTRRTPEENDQQGLIEGGMVRFGSRRKEPSPLGEPSPEWPPLLPTEDFDNLEVVPAQQPTKRHGSVSPSLPGFAFSAIQPAGKQLEPGNDIPGKWWKREPQSLLLQRPQPIEHTSPQSYESGKGGDALTLPKRNRHSFSPELLSSTSSPSYRDHSNPALLNPPKQLSSAVSSDAWNSSPLFPDQPGSIRSWQAEKLIGHWSLEETQQWWQSTDQAQSTATAEVSTWGANSRQQSGIAAGNTWDRGGSFSQNSIDKAEGKFSPMRRGVMPNLGWNSQQASATSSNYTNFPIRSEVRVEENYLSPTASKAGASRGPYHDPAAVPGNQRSMPVMAPYGSGIRATYTER